MRAGGERCSRGEWQEDREGVRGGGGRRGEEEEGKRGRVNTRCGQHVTQCEMVLCGAVQCCAMLCSAVQCCAVLCCTGLVSSSLMKGECPN